MRKHLRADRHIFNIIQKKIAELSKGHFSASNAKRLIGRGIKEGAGRTEETIPILEAKMTGDLRLVWRVDLYTDDDLRVIVIDFQSRPF